MDGIINFWKYFYGELEMYAIWFYLYSDLVFHFNVTNDGVFVARLKGAQPPVMPVYTGWLDCMGSLARGNDLKRGASALFRPVNITKLS